MKRAKEGLQERAVLEGRDCLQLQMKFRVLALHSRTHKQTAASEQGGTVRMIWTIGWSVRKPELKLQGLGKGQGNWIDHLCCMNVWSAKVERRRRSSRHFGFAPARPARRDLTVASSTIFGWFAAPSGRGRGGGEEPERVIWVGGDRPLLSLSLSLPPSYSFFFSWKLERERILLLYSLRPKKRNSSFESGHFQNVSVSRKVRCLKTLQTNWCLLHIPARRNL
jgi:hypothetical protein